MAARLKDVTVEWEAVDGATGWEIHKDGTVVATAGARARTAKVSVDDTTIVHVVDLPKRTQIQEVVVLQETSA